MTYLYTLESAEVVVLIEGDRVLKEHGGLPVVLDGDGDDDRGGHIVCLQVDVLLAVCPQQVRSQQGEPAELNHQTGPIAHFNLMSKVIYYFQSRNWELTEIISDNWRTKYKITLFTFFSRSLN